MRTHSRKIDTPSLSCGRANTTDPPQAPTIDDTLAALVNVSPSNACMLQTLVQHGIPDPEADHTYRDFLKTHPPIFHKAEEPLEADDWLRTIEQKFGLLHYSDIQKTLFVA